MLCVSLNENRGGSFLLVAGASQNGVGFGEAGSAVEVDGVIGAVCLFAAQIRDMTQRGRVVARTARTESNPLQAQKSKNV